MINKSLLWVLLFMVFKSGGVCFHSKTDGILLLFLPTASPDSPTRCWVLGPGLPVPAHGASGQV